MIRSLALALVLAAGAPSAASQSPDTLHVQLEGVEVTATRLAETAATVPLAVAVAIRGRRELISEPGESLESVLRGLPGLWISNRENFALGERLSVRGMGARAGFGVRGVQVVLDGIPLTLADGQSSLAIVDPALIRRAELIRGPASTIWGNASGGVLHLSTIPAETKFATARFTGGSFGLVRADGEGAVMFGEHRGGIALSHVRREGFRDHSAFEVSRGRGFARLHIGGDAVLTAVGAIEWAPFQQHPGALTAEELAASPRLAQENFVAQHAGKDSRQGQLGLAFEAPTILGDLHASAHAVARRMENPLPFAIIDLDRLAAGTRVALARQDGLVNWTAGVDLAVQHDDRQNWANLGGDRGDLRLDQAETVTGAGTFARGTIDLGALTLSAGLRHDWTRFSANDRLGADGDQSGSRLLAAWSPSLGASYRLGPAVAFVSYGTAFETPTTTELVNRPDGAGGFNPDLQPQRTHGFEAGVRGVDGAGRLYYDVAAFRLHVLDQLTPFEGADGRTYYRNAEATRHDGVEALLEWRIGANVTVGATYGFGRFVFADAGGDLAGNRLPGVPEHRLTASLRGSMDRLYGRLKIHAASPMWADDANTARTDGFVTLDLRLAYDGLGFEGAVLTPFVQVQNLTDARYAGSVAINAQGGRYFEPAAGRSIQAGLSLSVGR